MSLLFNLPLELHLMFGSWFSKKAEEAPVVPSVAPIPPQQLTLSKPADDFHPTKLITPELFNNLSFQLTNWNSQVLDNPATPQDVGMAGVFGVTAGYATRKLTKTASFFVGLGFMGLQGLAYCDIIQINWNKIESLAVNYADQDGDGHISDRDLTLGLSRFAHNLGSDFPTASAFAGAFWVGFRAG